MSCRVRWPSDSRDFRVWQASVISSMMFGPAFWQVFRRSHVPHTIVKTLPRLVNVQRPARVMTTAPVYVSIQHFEPASMWMRSLPLTSLSHCWFRKKVNARFQSTATYRRVGLLLGSSILRIELLQLTVFLCVCVPFLPGAFVEVSGVTATGWGNRAVVFSS